MIKKLISKYMLKKVLSKYGTDVFHTLEIPNDMKVISGPVEFIWGGKTYTYCEGTEEVLDKYKKKITSCKKLYSDSIKSAEDELTKELTKYYG